ncbi:RluA family pseudouridine synthase [Plebeiibacterium marinum]|uniref:RluA family pseudouridine synthase n=1 Tax=Plebeiibacterium marinum TaxID=2992111 RepID=A0AAE3ME60_9BACT|nr:RluA family pseudouridine synthase [Plebeiobacterium marinum]MCW3806201.1 RluA family pseudouridine synthase [Plebeiobacterium marinum]
MDHTSDNANNYFTYFQEDISKINLPEKFTYPFYYEPHPLCIIAAKELQQHLLTQQVWKHDFGIDHFVEGTNIGKMFGVMIVETPDGQIGYLKAFSGKLAGTNTLPGFVPPVYDLLDKNGFFKPEEDLISQINLQIQHLEESSQYKNLKDSYQRSLSSSTRELSDFKSFMKLEKKKRDNKRKEQEAVLSPVLFEELKEELKQESLKHQYDYKQLRKHWEAEVLKNKTELDLFLAKIDTLKDERKNRSALLQQKLFEQYRFLNFMGEKVDLCDIFKHTSQKIPPAGAGDCAAPKLLQYAYLNNFKPIAMAEFWWGQSPKSEIRKHGNFYPSCNSKCKPILGHMLKGLQVDENPIQNPTISTHELETVYEDDDIVVVNKPAEFLSVPGKETEDSVWFRMQQKYPDATGPLLVHRLDMSTSGLILIAKNKEAHKILQKQFLNRTVQKRYVALLDGIIKEDQGLVDLPLRVDLDDRPRQLVCYEYGKPARTKYKVLERTNGKTRVHFFPITGRTHQLRVHAAHPQGLNTPIVGDDLYGTKSNRLYLHAEYLEFIHPTSGKNIKIKKQPEF